MKVIMVMFDSLNRRHLPPYGCDWVRAPNFTRLAARSTRFDGAYVCSMPCMPARRDLHTGRPNFLHRGWGPLEPFDDSMPALLSKSGIYTHLATDHQHYFEDGGATYHTRYNSWEFFRGQEGDPWKGQVPDPLWPEAAGRNAQRDRETRQDLINRSFLAKPELLPQVQTFTAGIDFIDRNRETDGWFLQIETFDPHEPFFSNERYRQLYAEQRKRPPGPFCDWPLYEQGRPLDPQNAEVNFEYAALVSLCDEQLGRVLDQMDRHRMWEDTMLIVWTDHGFLLGEHDCWGKQVMPWYEELARTPFFVWDPRSRAAGESRAALVQPAIDLAPTILDFFGRPIPPDMIGKNLRATIADDTPVRAAALFGHFGGQLNVSDGRYVYMRGIADFEAPWFEHTLMPTHMRGRFGVDELAGHTELAPPFAFTKGCQLLKILAAKGDPTAHRATLLWDLEADPTQETPLRDESVEQRMVGHLAALLREAQTPVELYRRFGLETAAPGASSIPVK